ncbi:hypothetical protein ABNF65_15680, partial [Paenibacillus larvae]
GYEYGSFHFLEPSFLHNYTDSTPDPASGMMASIFKFMAIFCTTQVPIAIAEGLLTTIMYNLIRKNLPEKVAQLQ